MLADEIVNSKVLRGVLGGRGFADLTGRINAATRFVLDVPFVEAADALCHSDQLGKLIPFCKLPFDRVWFEFPSTHRSKKLFSRTGLLFEPADAYPRQRRDNGHLASLFYATLDYPFGFSAWQRVFDGADREKMIAVAANNNRTFDVPWYRAQWATEFFEVIAEKGPAAFGHSLEEVREKMMRLWDGESGFIYAVLALLNTRNVVDKNFTDKTELNRKRARIGRLPFFSHYTLKISTRIAAQIKVASGREIVEGSVRSHFVRGHWKTRKSGIYFWHPHRRGNPQLGHLVKDYELT